MTTPLWSAEEVLRAVHGRCVHEQTWTAQGVSIDTRTLQPGDLFVALRGPTHDSHAFVDQAFARGAVAALVDKAAPRVPADAPLVGVEDTLSALGDLARVARTRSHAKVLAVTGSVGKTSTKEQLRVMLESQGGVHASVGGLNNHWGVPLSLARLPEDTPYAVLEVGMNHPGEITPLTKLVRPHLALITTVEAVHLEYFPSLEAIADAKAEIFQGVETGGTAVLNRDNPLYARLAAAAKAAGIKTILSFGRDGKATARLLDLKVDAPGIFTARAVVDGVNVTYRLAAPHPGQVLNALGALLAVQAVGADLAVCALALEAWRPAPGRGTRHTVRLGTGTSFTLLDESYNASPVAVRAALAALGAAPVGPGGRRVAVLGDMRELGPEGPALHQSLAAAVEESNLDQVHVCGPLMAGLHAALPVARRGVLASNSADLAPVVAAQMGPGDVVMVKGSASMKMGLVVAALRALEVPAAAGSERAAG